MDLERIKLSAEWDHAFVHPLLKGFEYGRARPIRVRFSCASPSKMDLSDTTVSQSKKSVVGVLAPGDQANLKSFQGVTGRDLSRELCF
jgi:hypothetical protein